MLLTYVNWYYSCFLLLCPDNYPQLLGRTLTCSFSGNSLNLTTFSKLLVFVDFLIFFLGHQPLWHQVFIPSPAVIVQVLQQPHERHLVFLVPQTSLVLKTFFFVFFFAFYLSHPLSRPHPAAAAAAAKSLQSCLTLCDPIDSSPPGSPVPGILQARTLEWVAISFSSA